MAQLNVMIDCKKINTYSKHQLKLKQVFTKRFGDFRLKTLQFKLSILYQNLKAKSTKLKYNKRRIERKSINNKFRKNPKAVYRSMKGNDISATEISTTEDMNSFWKNIWGKESNFQKEAKWIKNLEKNYCKNVRQQPYKITEEILNKAVCKLFLGKSPGRDLIKGYWYKRLSFYKKHLLKLFQETYEGMLDLPNWLTLAQTTLLPKSQDTKNAKNYRAIACLNIVYKLYTSYLKYFPSKSQ